MPRVAVTMPVLGLTMEEGTVAEWLKQEGEAVARDEPLLTVEMDKGTVEVPAPAAGVLRRILVQPGTTVPVRTPIAEIADPADLTDPADEHAPDASRSPTAAPEYTPPVDPATGPADLPQSVDSSGVPPTSAPPPAAAAAAPAPATPRSGDSAGGPSARAPFASPRARRRARELGVSLDGLRGTGPSGRIIEADVLEVVTAPAADAALPWDAAPAPAGAEPDAARVIATPLARRLADEHGVDLTTVAGTGPGGRITHDDVRRAASTVAAAPSATNEPAPQPLSRVRALTAERLAASAQTTARVTLFLDADLTEAERFRAQLQPEFARRGTPRLPWDALIARATALALVEHPAVAAQWTATGLRPAPARIGIGVAVAIDPEGLVVPVLRDAATRPLRELADDLGLLVDRARAGRLTPAEMSGGALTVTNLGAYRVDGFTPLINPPETAILGVGRIAPRAVVHAGELAARTICTLSLSFDHRVVDGVPAAAFLARVAELLERPYALLEL